VADESLSGPLRCCFRCLELGHLRRSCSNDIKCLGCYGLGHKQRFCPLRLSCSYCHLMGHDINSCPNLTCRNCGDTGHSSKRCTSRKIWVKKRSNQPVLEGCTSRKIWVKKRSNQPVLEVIEIINSPPSIPHDTAQLGNLPGSAPVPFAASSSDSPPYHPANSPPTSSSPMANFPVRPFPFLSAHAIIDEGPDDRTQRSLIVVGEPPLSNEECAIVSVTPPVPDNLRRDTLARIVRTVVDDSIL
jgi:hypothetical protein